MRFKTPIESILKLTTTDHSHAAKLKICVKPMRSLNLTPPPLKILPKNTPTPSFNKVNPKPSSDAQCKVQGTRHLQAPSLAKKDSSRPSANFVTQTAHVAYSSSRSRNQGSHTAAKNLGLMKPLPIRQPAQVVNILVIQS